MMFFLVQKRQGILKLYLKDQKWSEQNVDSFCPNFIWPKYLNPEQQTDIVPQNQACLHYSEPFELKYHFQFICLIFVSYYLFAILRYKMKPNSIKFSRNYPPGYQKKPDVSIPGLIFFAHWINYKMNHYQCSHTRDLKHNSSLLLLVLVIVINSLKGCSLE